MCERERGRESAGERERDSFMINSVKLNHFINNYFVINKEIRISKCGIQREEAQDMSRIPTQ